jgi:hypothetical protein
MLSLSCATLLHPPKSSYSLDSKNSIIFGRDDVIFNGESIKYNGPHFILKQSIVHHISRYVSDEAINKNLWKPGEYSFTVTGDQDGYFTFAVPPGKYYFVEFDYVNVLPADATDLIWVRTYMPTRAFQKPYSEPYLMTFDVPPNRAVYIGTIRHEFHTIDNNLFYFKADWTINISNDFDSAQKWFLKSNGQFENDIVQETTETKLISINEQKATPFTQYDTSIINSINKSWYDLLADQKVARHKHGKIVLQFHLTYDGHITDMKVVEDNVGDGQALVCQKAVLAPTPYKSWPEDMIRMVGANYRVITFNFYYQ